MVLKRTRSNKKVTRKQRKPAPLRIANAVLNRTIKDSWDKSKSPSDNLSSFGLQADPNQTLDDSRGFGRKQRPKSASEKYAAFVGVAQLSDINSGETGDYKERNPKRKLLSEEKQLYVVANIRKHKDDYEAMKWDTETNPKQLTVAQMKRLCNQYESLPTEEILIEL